jgi:hypothetical protein
MGGSCCVDNVQDDVGEPEELTERKLVENWNPTSHIRANWSLMLDSSPDQEKASERVVAFLPDLHT